MNKIIVPDIGDFEKVEIIEILVKPGDVINKNDPVVTLESDKSSVEVPSTFAGKISELKVKIGDKVSKGSILALIENREIKIEEKHVEQQKNKTEPLKLQEEAEPLTLKGEVKTLKNKKEQQLELIILLHYHQKLPQQL